MVRTEVDVDISGTLNWLERQAQRIVRFPSVEVGWISPIAYPGRKDNATTVSVARKNISGHGNVPARDPLEEMERMYRKQIDRDAKQAFYSVLKMKNSLPTAVGLLSRNLRIYLWNAIHWGRYAPLSPRTIRRKGHSKPLIDSYLLANSIQTRIK